MLPPGGMSANSLAAKTGLNQSTLSRWLIDARTDGGIMDKPAKKWTPAEKLRVVVEASKLSDDELGEFLRREGVHEARLKEWREAAEASLVDTPRSKKKTSAEAKRIQELEREVRRKDKALAEASALLILKKKVDLIWGDVDDDTTEGDEK
jgi:transposase